MKKLLAAIASIFLCSQVFALPESKRCITETEGSPFKICPVQDGILLGASALTFGSSYLYIKKIGSFKDYDDFTYDKDDINPLDRKFARKYSKNLDHLATVTDAMLYAMPFAVYGTEFLLSNMDKNEALTTLVMYAQSAFITNTVKQATKMAVNRVRPYMYFDDFPEDKVEDDDFQFSFPSGHTIDAFMNATFLSYTFCKYYPDSKYRAPIIAASYGVAAATGALRMASGNHFFTDVLGGAALGSAIGFAVPFLHTFAARKSTSDMQLALSPTEISLSFKL